MINALALPFIVVCMVLALIAVVVVGRRADAAERQRAAENEARRDDPAGSGRRAK